jgi:hypothetical protein
MHNSSDPYDVNGDGVVSPLDVLALINYLNTSSSSSSSQASPQVKTASAAAATSSSDLFPDVLGTGAVTPLDVAAEIAKLQAGTTLVDVSLEAVDPTTGNVLSSVQVGQSFLLEAFAQDVQTNPAGFGSVYLNVSYASSLANIAQGATFTAGSYLTTTQTGPVGFPPNTVDSNGQVHDAGFFGSSAPPAGQVGSNIEVWSVPATATSAGTLTFTPSSSAADGGTGAYDIDIYVTGSTPIQVPAADVNFQPLTLSVTLPSNAPTISVAPATVNNSSSSNTTMNFTVSLTAASTTPVTFTYSTTDGTAVSGTNYTGVANQTATIPAGQTSVTVPITVLPGTVGESNTSFTLTISNITGDAKLGTATATGTIVNTDFPAVSIAPVSASVNAPASGSGTYAFKLTLSAASTQPITVNYSVANGGSTTNGSVMIAAGSTTGTINVPIQNDPTSTTSNVVVTLLSGTNVTLGTPVKATGVVDDLPDVSVANGVQQASASTTTNMTFTATLSAAATSNIVVNYTTTDGTAKSGTDYTGTQTGTFTIAAGQTTGTFTIPVLPDTSGIFGAAKTFTVNLSLANSATAILTTPTATGTINSAASEPTLTLSAPSTFLDPTTGQGSYVFTVTQSAASALATTFSYATSNGTAMAGTQYTATSGMGTIAAGATSFTFTVPIAPEAINEANTTFTATISSAVNATIATPTVTGTIVNQVAPPTITVGSTTFTDVTSGTGQLPVTVSLSAVSGQTVTFSYTTSSSSLIQGGTFSGTGTIAAGQTSTTIFVPTVAEAAFAPNATFTFTISSPTHVTTAGSTLSATQTITSSSAAPTVSIAGVASAVPATGTTTFAFKVSLSAASSVTTTLHYTTVDGTALAGVDYVAASGTLTIAAGQTSATINVTVDGQSLSVNKTFYVQISAPTNAVLGASQAAGVLEAYTPSSIAGYVFLDTNSNGKLDSGETVLPGVTLTLTGTSSVGGQAVSQTTTTNSAGAYSFSNLTPGVYVVTETEVSTYTGAKSIAGVDATISAANQLSFAITGLGGVTSTGDDFAYLGLPAGSISPGRGYLASDGSTATMAAVPAAVVASSAGASAAAAAVVTSHMSLSGDTLTVTGTGGADSFNFTNNGSTDVITFNGVTFAYNTSAVKAVVFNGLGKESVTLTGNGGDTADLSLGSGTFSGPGFTVTVNNVASIAVNGGAGSGNSVTLHDSALADYLNASGDKATLTNSAGKSVSVDQFSSVTLDTNSSGTLAKNVKNIDFVFSEI